MPLYPDITPFNQFSLPVGQGHTLYVEECGNPHGVPVLVLHGGPGGGISAHLRRFFDPAFWRIILFDQRGAGRSTPSACTGDNTTDHLVADMEAIRTHLGVDRWMLFGGSWGATLALRYACDHSNRVSAMVLRGVFLCRQQDLDWLYGPQGAARLRPDDWAAFVDPLPAAQRQQPLAAYHALLHGDDAASQQRAAAAWAQWEAACATLQPSATVSRGFAHRALALARIESHYFVHQGFIREPLLDHCAHLAGVPGIIVHGRYDLVCPLDQAMALHQHWPGSELTVVPAAGHSLAEPGIEQALVEAVGRMQGRFGRAI